MKKNFSLLIILFMFTSLSACSKKEGKLSVVCPNGAPAIAICSLDEEKYDISFGYEPVTLQTAFINKEADIIVAPINLGSTMYSKNQNYRLGAILTWGNLYLASKTSFTLDDLNNKDLVLFGQNTINDSIVQYIFKENNLTLGENTTYLGSTNDTQAKLLTSEDGIYLVAEPALSLIKTKCDVYSISIQEEYKKISKSSSYPQAACFIKNDLINNNKKIVDSFLIDIKNSSDKCQNSIEDVSSRAEELSLGKKNILINAIPNLNITYVSAKSSQSAIEFVVSINSKLFGGTNPTREFYYE